MGGSSSEANVLVAARALTGVLLSGEGQLGKHPCRHDPGLKTTLERTEAFTGETLVG